MTIKGLWDEVRKVVAGEDVPLTKLSAECVAEKGRPLRIAVDTPFAVFQYKEATRGIVPYGEHPISSKNQSPIQTCHEFVRGMNHPTRTLYHHSLHLLRAGVQPIFIYDGPGKPSVKRGVQVNRYPKPNSSQEPTSVSDYSQIRSSSARTQADIAAEYNSDHIIRPSKQILDFFGIPWRNAPGEAEAECAELEKVGAVDAVLTKDGDAFVFGSQVIIQRLDAKDQTAMVQRFQMQDLRTARPTLRQQDLFLMALMAGGDYDSAIPGCGPEIAIQAGRAGYSGELTAICRAGRSPDAWRARLIQELRSNNKGRFSCKWVQVAAAIPATFPNPTIVNFYQKPAVSSVATLTEYGRTIEWNKEADVAGIRAWTEPMFDWRFGFHAGKFVRTLAPSLLNRKLLIHADEKTNGSYLINPIPKAKVGSDSLELVRFEYQPKAVVDIDISHEPVVEGYRSNMKEVFDATEMQSGWIPKWLVEKGAPTAFKEWKAIMEKKSGGKKRKPTTDDQGETPKRPRGDGKWSTTPVATSSSSTKPTKKPPAAAATLPRALLQPLTSLEHTDPVASRHGRSPSSSPDLPDLADFFSDQSKGKKGLTDPDLSFKPVASVSKSGTSRDGPAPKTSARSGGSTRARPEVTVID